MTLHDKPDESLASLVGLGQKLFGSRLYRLRIAFDFNLSDRFNRHRNTLLRVQVLLRRDIERHQLQRELAEAFDHRNDDCSASLYNSRSA